MILFDSFCQNFVDARGYYKNADTGSVVKLDDESETIVEIVRIDNMRDGDTHYVCRGLAKEWRGSPCKLFVPEALVGDRLELDAVFPAPPSRDDELCRIANLPLPSDDDSDDLQPLDLVLPE